MTDSFTISGGKPLCGNVRIDGSKNAALPIIIASLMFSEPIIIRNIPDIRDTAIAFSLLESFGISINRIGNSATVNAGKAHFSPVSEDAGRLRAGIYFLGASLGRFGKAELPLPGGCNFGKRPIDFHLKIMEKMGADIKVSGNTVSAAGHLCGTDIFLPLPSVGATVNALLAAVTAKGVTVIRNAATEPHIDNLIRFLNAGGAKISGMGTRLLKVTGVASLHSASMSLIGDMIEAGTYLYFGLATGGSVTANGISPKDMYAVTTSLRNMGAYITEKDGEITLESPMHLRHTNVITAPYPGFPTDLHPLFTATSALADGESRLTETVWNDRFRYLDGIRAFGADVRRDENTVTVAGNTALHPAAVSAPDLRGGAAYLLLASAIKGMSRIGNASLIDRGYTSVEKKLRHLGCRIVRS